MPNTSVPSYFSHFICPISRGYFYRPVSLPCGHIFEEYHILQTLKNYRNTIRNNNNNNLSTSCPICKISASSSPSSSFSKSKSSFNEINSFNWNFVSMESILRPCQLIQSLIRDIASHDKTIANELEQTAWKVYGETFEINTVNNNDNNINNNNSYDDSIYNDNIHNDNDEDELEKFAQMMKQDIEDYVENDGLLHLRSLFNDNEEEEEEQDNESLNQKNENEPKESSSKSSSDSTPSKPRLDTIRIFDDEDFKRIHALTKRKNDKKRKYQDIIDANKGTFVDALDLQGPVKKRRLEDEERVEEKKQRKVKKDRRKTSGSKTQKEHARNKPFMMLKHSRKVKGKKKMDPKQLSRRQKISEKRQHKSQVKRHKH
eukprot:gb/GECH01008994.1/.p1 GENE.gb/GECH01008994.1/~~gb/GECH01008994.1/.p1  ORF type:complete len:373 (+),score=129.88 gb/GECH01008994.1/:1-1119(+)